MPSAASAADGMTRALWVRDCFHLKEWPDCADLSG